MYKKILLLSSALSTAFILGGCTLKENSNISQLFKKDDIYHISLQNTKKAQLIASLETKALLTATYLNPVYTHDNCKNLCMSVSDAEYFFVGVYITDSEKSEFNNKGYLLTLNGAEPIEIKKLEKDDPLRYQMPMMNNWSTYYKVKFPIVKGNDMQLIFENDRFGKDILEYSKGQKPLFETLRDLGR
ncbi:hypothetical protein KKC13_01625 [bacterium]|nr:hypothetical protein [bacterium]MBU1957574.1 hypothetical protein [bacterium]